MVHCLCARAIDLVLKQFADVILVCAARCLFPLLHHTPDVLLAATGLNF